MEHLLETLPHKFNATFFYHLPGIWAPRRIVTALIIVAYKYSYSLTVGTALLALK